MQFNHHYFKKNTKIDPFKRVHFAAYERHKQRREKKRLILLPIIQRLILH